MIDSLDEAWRWYESTRQLAGVMARLGAKHWDALPWEGELGRDEQLRGVTAESILEQAADVLTVLDDLCVLVFFSVFESIVRQRILTGVREEAASLRHLVLQRAAAVACEAVETGSFFKILEPYKAEDAELVELVNQVRRYRNWVAHGMRGIPPSQVDPTSAIGRLQRFLDRFVTPLDALS